MSVLSFKTLFRVVWKIQYFERVCVYVCVCDVVEKSRGVLTATEPAPCRKYCLALHLGLFSSLGLKPAIHTSFTSTC